MSNSEKFFWEIRIPHICSDPFYWSPDIVYVVVGNLHNLLYRDQLLGELARSGVIVRCYDASFAFRDEMAQKVIALAIRHQECIHLANERLKHVELTEYYDGLYEEECREWHEG